MNIYVHNWSHLKGDTYPRENDYVYTILKNGDPLDLTDALIEIEFRVSADHDPVMTWSSDPEVGGVVIDDDPTLGKFKYAEQIIDLKAGVYKYDVQITIDGVKATYLKGELTIVQDITQL